MTIPFVETEVTGKDLLFDAPDTSQLDTPEESPIDAWLAALPTATETDPD